MEHDAPYTPIDCSFHDRLEHHAVLGRVVSIVLRDEGADGGTEMDVRVRDVFARNGADWVQFVTRDGKTRTVRADAILSVNGVLPSQSGACR